MRRNFSKTPYRVEQNRSRLIFEEPILYIFLYFFIHLYPFLKIPVVGSAAFFLLFLSFALRERDTLVVFVNPMWFYLCIGFTVSIFILSYFANHGYYATNLQFVYRTARGIPDFLMGLYLINRRNGLFYFLTMVLTLSALTSLTSIVFNIQYFEETGRSALRESSLLHTRYGQSGGLQAGAAAGVTSVSGAAVRSYIFLMALGGFFFFYRFLKPLYLLAYLMLLSMLLAGSILSGLTTPIFIVGIGMLGYGLLRIRKASFMVTAIPLIGVFVLGVYLSYSFDISIFTRFFDRAVNILTVVFSNRQDIYTIDRYTLFMTSWKTFLSNPVFGVGGMTFFSGIGEGVIGGHSGFADFLGQYGLFGALGIGIILVNVFNKLKPWQSKKKLIECVGPYWHAHIVFWIVLMVHSFVNPTFGDPEINKVIFVFCGLLFGAGLKIHPTAALLPPIKLTKARAFRSPSF